MSDEAEKPRRPGMAKGYNGGGIRDLSGLLCRCTVDPMTDCWVWSMCVDHGSPRVYLVLPDGKARSMSGRQAALTLAGRPPEPGHWSFAKAVCKNSLCCNPDHATSGSPKQAGQAYARSGVRKNNPARKAAALAHSVKRRKLTPEQAAEIRISTETYAVLAERYNVSTACIYRARFGRTYMPKGFSVFSVGAAR